MKVFMEMMGKNGRVRGAVRTEHTGLRGLTPEQRDELFKTGSVIVDLNGTKWKFTTDDGDKTPVWKNMKTALQKKGLVLVKEENVGGYTVRQKLEAKLRLHQAERDYLLVNDWAPVTVKATDAGGVEEHWTRRDLGPSIVPIHVAVATQKDKEERDGNG